MSTQPAFTSPLPPLPSRADLTWLGIDMDAFVADLQQRIPGKSIQLNKTLAENLLQIHPLLRPAFKLWWETGEIADMGSFAGYTVNDLMTGAKGTIKFKPTGLFLMLNTLITDPEKGKQQLQRRIHGVIHAPGHKW
jgi:hypothetical protein